MTAWNRVTMGIAAVALSVIAGSAWGISPTHECTAAKNKIAGKYALCRQRVEAKAIKTGEPVDYSKCDTRYVRTWAKAELNGGGMCLTMGDHVAMQTFITEHTDVVAVALLGAGLPRCGDNAINVAGEQCDGPDLAGETCATLGFSGGTLACAACLFDTSACQPCGEGPICGDNVINVAGEQCDGADLAGETCATLGFAGGSLACNSCLFDTSACACPVPALPASGQTTAYGTGSDGDVEAGAALSYTDNGDGTITDNNTGLMWEKKDDSGGIHDWDNTYAWCVPVLPGGGVCNDGADPMDGSIVTTFLSMLNGGAGFAGHTDWRIPNYKELMSILDLENSRPAVSAVFHQSATCAGCTDVTAATCSCTRGIYWSSTTYQQSPAGALAVSFDDGQAHPYSKAGSIPVRAVRGGS